MKIIKNKVIECNGILNTDTKYLACTFYFEKDHFPLTLRDVVFDNCSFRTKVHFKYLSNVTFNNCGFSSEVWYSTLCVHEFTKKDLVELTKYNIFTHMQILGTKGICQYFDGLSLANWTLKLQYLQINSCNFYEIPEAICSLENLTHLDMRQNQIPVVPESIMMLQKLKYLNLENNAFLFVPYEIGYLNHLEELYITLTRMRSFYQEILECKSLRKFSCTKNFYNYLCRVAGHDDIRNVYGVMKIALPNCQLIVKDNFSC